MLLKRLIIVGHPQGQLAGAIYKCFRNAEWVTDLEALFYNTQMNLAGMTDLDSTVVVYTGEDGASLEAACLMCTSHKLPLIQASVTEVTHPITPLFPYIKMLTTNMNGSFEPHARAAFHLCENVLMTKIQGRLDNGVYVEEAFLG
jgi:hypothetical protein